MEAIKNTTDEQWKQQVEAKLEEMKKIEARLAEIEKIVSAIRVAQQNQPENNLSRYEKFRLLARSYQDSISMHGLSKILTTHSKIEGSFWSILLTAVLAFSVFLMRRHIARDIIFVTEVNEVQEMKLPKIIACQNAQQIPSPNKYNPS